MTILFDIVGDFNPASTVGLRYVLIYQERFGLLVALLPLPTYFNRTVLATPITDQVVTSCSKVMVVRREKGVVEVPKYGTRSKMITILGAVFVETSNEQLKDKLLNDFAACPTAKWIKPSQTVHLFFTISITITFFITFMRCMPPVLMPRPMQWSAVQVASHPLHTSLYVLCWPWLARHISN